MKSRVSQAAIRLIHQLYFINGYSKRSIIIADSGYCIVKQLWVMIWWSNPYIRRMEGSVEVLST